MTRDPGLESLLRARSDADASAAAGGIRNCVLAVAATAAISLLAAHLLLGPSDFGAATRWVDLSAALLIGMVVSGALLATWVRSSGSDDTGWTQRANALLLVFPVAFTGSFYMLELDRLTHAPQLFVGLSALALAAACAGVTRWITSLARMEHEIVVASATGSIDPGRPVASGIIGLLLLLAAMGAIRNVEYTRRNAVLDPTAELIDAAGRQRMLGQRLGRLAARIALEPRARRDMLVAEFGEAAAQLEREGMQLQVAQQAWFLLDDADTDHGEDALVAASESRKRILAAARDVQARYAGARNASAESERLQLLIDAGLPKFDAAVGRLLAASEHGRRELRQSMTFGFALLLLVVIVGGAGASRAVSRIVRRQHQASLRHNAALERLAIVVRSTTNLVLITDVAGNITWVNAAFEELTGYTLAEVAGRRPGSFLQCADSDPQAIAAMHDAVERVEAVTVEILNHGKDGNRYWSHMNIEPLRDAAGRHDGFMAIQTDITEAVQLRAQRREIFHAMAAGIVIHDSDGSIIDFNGSACRLLGLGAEQLRGRKPVDPCWQAIHEDGSEFTGDQHFAMQTLRSGEPISDGVMGIATPDGERRWLSVSTRAVADAKGGGRQVIVTFSDLTPRKQAEAELAHERARLSAALDGTGAGAWQWRIQEGVVVVDSRWADIVGGGLPADYRVPIGEWMRRLHPDDAAIAAEAAEMHFCGVSDRFDAELRVHNNDGKWVWVHCRGHVTESDAAGKPLSMYGTLVDITARREAAVAIASEQDKLQRLFELAPFGIALTAERDARVLDCNEALLHMLGMSRGQLYEHRLSDLTPDEYSEQWQRSTAEMLAQGRSGPYEKEYLRADGSRVPVLVIAQRITLTDGSSAVWVIVQDITARKAMEAGLQLEARTDKLTGLANRQALMERLEAAVELARRDARVGFGLLFLDFDRFKLVNDTLGHEAGDELLRKIADRLRRSLRGAGGDTGSRSFVARIGGDEFVVLVSDTAELAEIERVSQRLLAALATPYMIRGSEVQSSASIGVVSSLQGELDASAVLRNADTAMYEAKRRGRGVAVLFDDGMHARLQREVVIERNLRRAIAMGEISLLYQPIIDLESGELSSMEALVRWRSAELGDVSPNEFIPIAEECGAIMELGEWVLYEACDQFAEWATNHPLSQATISVNLSRVQMGKPENLLATVERTLSATGLEAARLQLEVTERDVMRDPLAVIELMRKLRALGVRLAMDDFGTGTSSLACLRDYPFDVIKIDRAFVGDLTSNGQVLALVHATMMLIENLGMASVAEGVETAAQAAILQSVGCRYGQGWLFGVPARLGEVVERVGEA